MSDDRKLQRGLQPRKASGNDRKVADTFKTGARSQSKTKRMKTSLALDVDLYRRAKIAAIGRGMSVTEFIEEGIRKMF